MPPPPPSLAIPLRHRVLVAMTMVVLAGATALGVAGRVPIQALGSTDRPEFIARTFAVVEIAVLGAAVLILARRIPRRRRDQSLDGYWSEVGGRATLLWFVIEITAALGAMAFLLTAQRAPMLVSVVALLVLVRLSPARFAQGVTPGA